MQVPCANKIALQRSIDNGPHHSRRLIGDHGNYAIAAQCGHRYCHVIVSGEDAKVARPAADDFHDLGEASG